MLRKLDFICLVLGSHAQKAGFPLLPEYHLMCHLPQQVATGGVPRMSWVYLDESKNAYLVRLSHVNSVGAKLNAKGFAERVMEMWEWSDKL